MQAKCPHCQSIFTAERPGVQFCPNCGKQLNIPDVTTVTTTPPTASGSGGPGFAGQPPTEPPGREDTPWERMSTLGFGPGLFETWKALIVRPQPFLATVRPQGSWTMAVGFAWVVYAAGQLLNIPLQILNSRRMMEALNNSSDMLEKVPPNYRHLARNLALMQSHGARFSLFGLVLFPLFLILGAGLVHLFCLLFGANKYGFHATLRALSYAMAPSVFGFVSGLGPLACLSIFVLIWQLVLATMALQSLHETTTGKAVAAILAPGFIWCCCVCGLIAAFAGTVVAALANH